MNYLKKLSPYSISEKFKIFKYSIGYYLVKHTPQQLKDRFFFTSEALERGIDLRINKSNFEFTYSVNGAALNFSLDSKETDILIFNHIIIKEEYKTIIEIMRSNKIPCNTMIDAGANIGLTGLYFKAFFPEVNIVALEPNAANFSRLNNHIEINNLKNITLLNKGLWSHTTRLKGDNSFRGGESWSFRLVDALDHEEALIEAVSIQDLIKEYSLTYIDFLKIDIEGAEKEIFKDESALDWLKCTKLIAIEIHDEFLCRGSIEKILMDNNFELSYSWELTIGINRNLIP